MCCSGCVAVDLDRDSSYAHWCLGEIQHYRRKYSEARSQLQEALRLNPNDVDALSMYGYFLACMGDHDKSLAQLERASRLDPYESYMHPWLSGAACYLAGRYEEAVQHLNRISDPLPEVYAWLAAAHGQLGQVEEAQRQAARFLAAAEAEMAVFPGRRLEDWEGYCRDIGCGPAGTADHFLEGLRAAWPGD